MYTISWERGTDMTLLDRYLGMGVVGTPATENSHRAKIATKRRPY